MALNSFADEEGQLVVPPQFVVALERRCDLDCPLTGAGRRGLGGRSQNPE